MNPQQQCKEILETYGGATADKAVKMLLEDPALEQMKPILEFISKTWRDPLTPAMINLACQAVGGKLAETQDIAIAVSYMNLSFRIWDDIIDKTLTRQFKTTVVGKFDASNALIIGGVVSAKAFTIINQLEIDHKKRQVVSGLLWNYWAKMAETEAINQKPKSTYTADDKLAKIESEAVNLETCLRLGAILGNGSNLEIEKLAIYGRCLGIVLELLKDYQASLNLTVELEEKIRSGCLTLAFLRGIEQSEPLKKRIALLSNQPKMSSIEIKDVINLMLQTDSLEYINQIMKKNVETAKRALYCMGVNDETEKLGFFIEAQICFRDIK